MQFMQLVLAINSEWRVEVKGKKDQSFQNSFYWLKFMQVVQIGKKLILLKMNSDKRH